MADTSDDFYMREKRSQTRPHRKVRTTLEDPGYCGRRQRLQRARVTAHNTAADAKDGGMRG